MGTEIHWEDCDIDGDKVDDALVKCNIFEEESTLKCKLYPSETGISTYYEQIHWNTHSEG